MAIRLKDKPNTEAPDGKFPFGAIKDDTGSDNGTPIDKEVYDDFHQFFARLMDYASRDYPGFDYNNLPESWYDDFQYIEALMKVRFYKIYTALIYQNGTNAPTVEILEDQNTIGTIVFTRTGVGIYRGTLTGAFPSLKTWLMLAPGSALGPGFFSIFRVDNNFFAIETRDTTGAAADSLLDNSALEIRVMR